jgi:hypothetical protein
MGTVQIRDVMIWSAHIEGDQDLVRFIEDLAPQHIVTLEVDSFVGEWGKIAQGTSPTGHALKPIGKAKNHWHELFQHRRGEQVTVSKI